MLGAVTVYIVLYEPITTRYVGRMAKGDLASMLSQLRFSRADNIIRWLNTNQTALDIDREAEVVKFLSVPEREMITRTGTSLIIPLIVVNRLTGAVFLTRRRDAGPYVLAEIEALMMLVSQSALAIEHALMYQFQEDRLKKIFHADKLATVGELAAGAAHEIRNPLTSIRSTAQYLRKDLPEGKKSLVDGIIGEVNRIDQIIEGLLSFSKFSDLHMGTIDVAEILNQTTLLLEPELRKHSVGVRKQFHAANPRLAGDPAQLKQVFLNLLLNGIQAMPQGGTIVITIDELPGAVAREREVLQITIADDGPGIPSR